MRHAPLLLLLALAGCGRGDNAPGPGGVTIGEARALDEAAEMLEAQRSPADGAARIPAPLPPDAPKATPSATMTAQPTPGR